MAKKVTYSFQGRDWSCEFDPQSGHWTAATDSPQSVIVGPTWDALKDAMRAFDPAHPRVDAVAVCDPLPPMGSKAGF